MGGRNLPISRPQACSQSEKLSNVMNSLWQQVSYNKRQASSFLFGSQRLALRKVGVTMGPLSCNSSHTSLNGLFGAALTRKQYISPPCEWFKA